MNSLFPVSRDRGERILVVDDNEAGRYAKVRILRQAGYAVMEAENGGDTLRLVGNDSPDLVLLDVRLPDMSGLDVCRQIKENPRTSMITVLQMSASFRDDQSKVAGLACGADGYVTEPVEPSVLVATIAAFLRTRRAEQAERNRALEWQATFDAITDGVAVADVSGRILRSNRALAGFFNRNPGELAGVAIEDLLPAAPDEPPVWRDLDGHQRQKAERSVGDRVFAVTVDPLRDDHGRPRGGVCIVSDITEQKLVEERLRHTQKLESIGLLAGGVAHDFNNLLMGILGNASLGLEDISDRSSIERALKDIMRAGERAADLTRQLLAYAGKGKIVVQPLDLSRTVSGMLELVKVSFPRKVRLVLNLADDLPAIKADKTQIEQVVMNLLINAAEAIGDKAGSVKVTTRAVDVDDQQPQYLSEEEVRGRYVMLKVHDDGAGMDEETVRQIFDPFFTTKFMGRGLGLSAVLGIVRGHKGAIRVTSAPGRGATFELLFPSVGRAAGERATRYQVSARAAVRSGGGTILVVDDEQIVRDFFQSALERHGYQVVLARDGAEALRIFAEDPNRFSIVLLDMVMPVMNGKEVLPRLLELRPDARIVVTSGQVEEEVRRDLGGGRVAGFLQKPCRVEALVDKIRESAGTKALAQG